MNLQKITLLEQPIDERCSMYELASANKLLVSFDLFMNPITGDLLAEMLATMRYGEFRKVAAAYDQMVIDGVLEREFNYTATQDVSTEMFINSAKKNVGSLPFEDRRSVVGALITDVTNQLIGLLDNE